MEINKLVRLGNVLNRLALMFGAIGLGGVLSKNFVLGVIMIIPAGLISIFTFFFIDLRIMKHKIENKNERS